MGNYVKRASISTQLCAAVSMPRLRFLSFLGMCTCLQQFPWRAKLGGASFSPRFRCHLVQFLWFAREVRKHHACKSEWFGQFDMEFSAPISKHVDSQGMAASRAAHFPHILRASRQMTAAARHNVYFCLKLIQFWQTFPNVAILVMTPTFV